MAVTNRVLLVALLLATIRQQISGARVRRYSWDLEQPQNPELVAVNSTCVRFTWDPPKPGSSESLQGYEYYCGRNDYTNVSTSTREVVSCGYYANYEVYCEVSAIYQSDKSYPVFVYTYTKCSNPSPPTNIVVEDTDIHIADKWQWNVTLSWQRPSTIACYTITSYSLWYKVNGGIWRSQVLTEPISNVILMDAYKNLEASVSATNNGNFTSSNVTKTFISPVLPPQFGPRNVTIRVANLTCITMTWMEPQYPNGPIEGYQVKCHRKEKYESVGNRFSYTRCGFSLLERVECLVRTKNSLAYSEESYSNTIRLLKCVEPARPVFNVTDAPVTTCNGAEKMEVTVSWKASTHHCQYMKYYKVTLDSTEKLVSPWDVLEFTFRELNPQTTYNLSVTAVNNEDYTSTSTRSFTTRLVRPAPPTLSLTFNTSCVNVWVTGPSEPYHHISQYKLRCYYSEARADSPPPLNESASDVDVLKGSMWVRCGFTPGTKLICDATSTNAAGESALVSHKGYTTPEDLAAPEELINTQSLSHDSVAIASVVSSAVVIVGVLIIGVVLYRRRVQPSAYCYYSEGNSTSLCTTGAPTESKPHPTPKGARASSIHLYEELRISTMSGQKNDRGYEHVLLKDQSISTQFERLEEAIGQIKFDYNTAKFPMNIEKNRFKDILPTSEHAVSINGADYINAVFVNSFHQENQFIATQFPLSQTTSDFWKMIHERKVNVVVQLLPEMLDYYPDTDGDEFYLDWGEMQREASSENSLVKLIHLTVEDRPVSVIKVINWSDDPQKGKEMPKISSLLYYFEAMDSYSADGNICVTDMTGSKQAGIFIAGYNLVAAIKSHQEPNLYTTVLEARKRRPQFVSDLASYTYLDEVRRSASKSTEM